MGRLKLILCVTFSLLLLTPVSSLFAERAKCNAAPHIVPSPSHSDNATGTCQVRGGGGKDAPVVPFVAAVKVQHASGGFIGAAPRPAVLVRAWPVSNCARLGPAVPLFIERKTILL